MLRSLAILLRNALVALVALLQAFFRLLVRARPIEWVAYELDGAITRGPPEDTRSFVLRLPVGAKVRTLVQLRRELAHLAAVPGLKGVVVRIENVHCGGAVLRELRGLFEAFRAAGKQVVVHADALGMREYWLASVADQIWLAPRGRLELSGFAATSSAAARPLAWLGVAVHVVRAGAFKSAGELLGAEKVSDAQKLQLDELIGDLHVLVATDVARGRNVPIEQVERWIDDGPCSATTAVERGIVDGACYADELREKLGEGRRARIGPFAAALATRPAKADWLPLRDPRPVVALVDVAGLIMQGKSRSTPWTAATAGSETLVAALTRLRRDRRVKAVVLRIDSRGGSALASDLIWHATRKLAARKPVVAFLEDVAASGGYYIAAGAHAIHAAPSCITGSIGVFSMRPDTSGTYGKLGIDHAVVQRGRHASALRPDIPFSDDDRALLERDVHETYESFLAVVAEGRQRTVEEIRPLAEGRVYLAGRALRLGLVDRLSTIEETLQDAAVRAGIEGPVRVAPVRPRASGLGELWRAFRRESERARAGEHVLARWDGLGAEVLE